MENPNFYAIIPANVRYDKNLCPNAKLLYGEITALCNSTGYCWASNDYFAELYGVKKQTISLWIQKLKKHNFINIQINRKEGNKRLIGIFKKDDTYIKKSGEVYEKNNIPILKKQNHNNTYNNTSNNTDNISSYKEDSETEFFDKSIMLNLPDKKTEEKKEYGNKQVNELIEFGFNNNFGLQGSKTKNRRYAWLLFKTKGIDQDAEKVKSLVLAAIDLWGVEFKIQIVDWISLYYNWGRLIINKVQEQKNQIDYIS